MRVKKKKNTKATGGGKNRKLILFCCIQALNGKHLWRKEKEQVLPGPTELKMTNKNPHSAFFFFFQERERSFFDSESGAGDFKEKSLQ